MKNSKKKSSFRNKVGANAKRQKTAGSSYGYLRLPKGINVFSATPGGRVTLDFLPYVVSDAKHPDRDDQTETAVVNSLWYKRPFKVHRNVGASNETEICLQSFGEKCPICEHRAKLMKEGTDRKETDELRPSQRNLYIVIPKGMKDFEEKPHIFDISQYLFQNLLNDELEEDEDNGVFPDLEEGLTLKIRFDSTKIGTGQPFATASRIDFVKRDEPYDSSILKDVPDLDTVLNRKSYDELEAKFFEVDSEEEEFNDESEDEEDEEEKEDKKPVSKMTRKSKKAKPEPEDEDKEDEDEEEEEEEETDISELSRTELKAYIKENNLDIVVTKKMSDDDIRDLIYDAAEESEEEEEEEPEEEKEDLPFNKGNKNGGKSNSRKQSSPSKEKCPYGHKFGVDTEEYDECDECDLWEKCIDKKEA